MDDDEFVKLIPDILDDEILRYAFAKSYNLNYDEHQDLVRKIHEITGIKAIYEAKPCSYDSVIEYLDKVKKLVSSDDYKKNLDDNSKIKFEIRMFKILNNIVAKAIGSENFTLPN